MECYQYQGEHYLYNCEHYLKADIPEKWKMIKDLVYVLVVFDVDTLCKLASISGSVRKKKARKTTICLYIQKILKKKRKLNTKKLRLTRSNQLTHSY